MAASGNGTSKSTTTSATATSKGKAGSKTGAGKAKSAAAAAGTAIVVNKAGHLADLLTDQLSNLLYDLLKEGWLHGAPLMAEILQNLSFTQYLGFVGADDGADKASSEKAYKDCMNSLLSAIVGVSRRVDEIKRLNEEYGVSVQQIAQYAAEQLIDYAQIKRVVEIDELMRMLNAYAFKSYLEVKLPEVQKAGARRG